MSTPSVLSTIDPKFITNRQGRDFVLYAGLLDLAHRSGLKRISTTLIQAPSDANNQTAICRAEVELDRGVFDGIGDANPANVGKMIAMHSIRMAETRAKARALRDALNVGGAAYEELGPEDEDTQPARPSRPFVPSSATAAKPAAPNVTPQRGAPIAPNLPGSEETMARILKVQTALYQLKVEVPTADYDNMTEAQARAFLDRLEKFLTKHQERIAKNAAKDVGVPAHA